MEYKLLRKENIYFMKYKDIFISLETKCLNKAKNRAELYIQELEGNSIWIINQFMYFI